MKKILVLTLLTGLTTLSSQAAVTITFGVQVVYNADGSQLIPENSLVLYGVSTTDGSFGDPTPTAFFSGDDAEIHRGGAAPAGEYGYILNIELSSIPNWTTGDPLQIYWFPTLTTAATAPGYGTPYGSFRTDALQDNDGCTISWVTPSDGGVGDTLNFLTGVNSSYNPASAGYATGLTAAVPEPSTYAMVFGVICLAGAIIRRKIRC